MNLIQIHNIWDSLYICVLFSSFSSSSLKSWLWLRCLASWCHVASPGRTCLWTTGPAPIGTCTEVLFIKFCPDYRIPMYCICCVDNSKSDYVFYGWPQMEYDMTMKQTSVQRSSRGQSWVRSWERGGSGWGDSGKASILEGSTYPTWKSGLSRIG